MPSSKEQNTRRIIAMQAITLPLSNCHECGLYKPQQYNPHVYVGNLESPKVLFVIPAPTGTDTVKGSLLNGKPGKLLKRELDKAGITDWAVYSVVGCKATKVEKGRTKDRKPTSTDIKHCKENLEALIDQVKPGLIVPLGAIALSRMKITGGITNTRGMLFDNEYGRVLPAFDPAYILRNPEKLEDLQADLEVIKRVSEGGDLSLKKLEVVSHIAETREDIDLMEKTLSETDYFAFDIETDSLDPLTTNVMGIGFACDDDEGYYIPFLNSVTKDWYWVNEEDQTYAIEATERILTARAKKIAHNGKFDTKCMSAAFDIQTTNFWMDTMLLHYLIDENSPHGLKIVGPKFFPEYRNYQMELKDALSAKGFEDEDYGNVPLDILGPYCIKDCVLTYRLAKKLYSIASEAEKKLLFYFYMPLSHIYGEAELTGIKVDREWIKGLIESYTIKEANELKTIFEYVGREFNLNSSQQMVKILFNPKEQPADWEATKVVKKATKTKEAVMEEFWPGLGFPIDPDKMTDGGQPSTAEGVLKDIPQRHPNYAVIEHILNYRGYTKMLSTYLKPFLRHADDNGRIHTSFKLHGTVSGRLSSKPNVQNIPRLKEVKGMFIRAEGYDLVEIDYSQAELRVMAFYSKDPTMVQVYKDNGDLHMTTALTLFPRLKPEEIDKEKRKKAKLGNFGAMYGGSPTTIQRGINDKLELGEKHITLRVAEQLRAAFFKSYPGVDRFIKKSHEVIHDKAQLTSVFGRTRRLPQVKSPEQDLVAKAEREGLNALVQGTASDLTQLSLIKIANYIKQNNLKTRFLFSVHDALIFEVAHGEMEHVREFKALMEKSPKGFEFPLIADVEKFPMRWGTDSEDLFVEGA
jgi:DNA polymerase I